jgi:hypothetical protein
MQDENYSNGKAVCKKIKDFGMGIGYRVSGVGFLGVGYQVSGVGDSRSPKPET